jgi:hypothetical protein
VRYLHQGKIAKLEFALEAMICGLHEVDATRTLPGQLLSRMDQSEGIVRFDSFIAEQNHRIDSEGTSSRDQGSDDAYAEHG